MSHALFASHSTNMADDGESLESWLNKATNPSNRQEDWEYIMGFCDQVNKELEGPQISVRLLAHKIQSPQEWEAMQSLMVLEACMKNCGRRFHTEVAKFKFLNELIKVISPKYLGDKVSEKVKTKVIEMLYSWTLSLPDEAKICEAYQMLKSQGVVLVDPEIPLDATLIPSPSPRAKNPVFDDEKKSKRLAQLLKSKKPEDLQEANRLIKNMVKEDEVRTQKATKQKNTLEAVNNSVKLLTEMLAHFSPEDSTDGDKELIKELYSDCDKLRQTVSQIASETEDNDSSLGDILQASDNLSHIINSCQKIVEGLSINGEAVKAQQTQSPVRQEILIDLVGLDTPGGSVSQQQSSVSVPADLLSASVTADSQSPTSNTPSAALSLLDEELLSLGLNEPVPVPSKSTPVNLSNHVSSLQPVFQDSSQALDIFGTSSSTAPALSASIHLADALPVAIDPVNSSKCSTLTTSALSFPGPMYSLTSVSANSVSTTSATFSQPLSAAVTPAYPAALSRSLSVGLASPSASHVTPQQVSIPDGVSPPPSSSLSHNLQDLALLDLGRLIITPSVPESTTSTPQLLGGIQSGSTAPPAKNQMDDSPPLRSLSPITPLNQASPGAEQEVSLANVFVPLEAIKPSQACPVTAYDKNGVRVLLHFATDCPAGRPDVLVMVASMLNTAPLPVKDIVLQAAVPKMMKVRLQAPSGTELAPFNPILPPAAITQVVLLANPLKEKVRMRYKLTFTLGEQPYTEVGEVNEFPPADRWGAL